MKPKYHWCYDIAEQLERDQGFQVLLDAFVVERLHLRFRDIGNRIDNQIRYERTLLTRAIIAQKSSLCDARTTFGLLGPTETVFPDVPELVMGARLQHGGKKIDVGDVVFLYGMRPGMVKACVRQNVTLLVIVQLYQLLEKISEHSGTWQLSEDREAWHASDVQLALAWYEHGEHTTVIKR